jgi:CSLREA domain-containing protein
MLCLWPLLVFLVLVTSAMALKADILKSVGDGSESVTLEKVAGKVSAVTLTFSGKSYENIDEVRVLHQGHPTDLVKARSLLGGSNDKRVRIHYHEAKPGSYQLEAKIDDWVFILGTIVVVEKKPETKSRVRMVTPNPVILIAGGKTEEVQIHGIGLDWLDALKIFHRGLATSQVETFLGSGPGDVLRLAKLRASTDAELGDGYELQARLKRVWTKLPVRVRVVGSTLLEKPESQPVDEAKEEPESGDTLADDESQEKKPPVEGKPDAYTDTSDQDTQDNVPGTQDRSVGESDKDSSNNDGTEARDHTADNLGWYGPIPTPETVPTEYQLNPEQACPIGSVQGQEFAVNSTVDRVDESLGDGVCSTGKAVMVGGTAVAECTLRAAIQEANSWSGPDTVTLPAGTYTLALSTDPPTTAYSESNIEIGDLDITEGLTVIGAGQNQTIISADRIVDRVFEIRPRQQFPEPHALLWGWQSMMPWILPPIISIRELPAPFVVTMKDLTIQRGRPQWRSTGYDGQVVIHRNVGGGIWNRGQILSLHRVRIHQNDGRLGGGIYNDRGELCLSASRIDGNTVDRRGGGIENKGLLIARNRTFIENNLAPYVEPRSPGELEDGAYHNIWGGGGIASYHGDTYLMEGTQVRSNQPGGILLISGYDPLSEIVHATAHLNGVHVADNHGYQGGITSTGANHLIMYGLDAAHLTGQWFTDCCPELFIESSTIVGNSNSAQYHGVLGGTTGGGISTLGNTFIIDSQIVGNSSIKDGGGIHIVNGHVLVRRTLISGNTARDGGGLAVRPEASTVISQTTIEDNVASRRGGGLTLNSCHPKNYGFYEEGLKQDCRQTADNTTSEANYGIRMSLKDSTVVRNRAEDAGGGIFSGGWHYDIPEGDAVSFFEIINSTIHGNITEGRGSGLYISGHEGVARLHNTTITNNERPAAIDIETESDYVEVANTLLANNHGLDCRGGLNSLGHNLDSDNTCGLVSSGDLPGIADPRVGGLAWNGGPTQTAALLSGSPAIDAGDNSLCPPRDQRGVLRGGGTLGGPCDIGAYEVRRAIQVEPDTLTDHPATSTGPQHNLDNQKREKDERQKRAEARKKEDQSHAAEDNKVFNTSCSDSDRIKQKLEKVFGDHLTEFELRSLDSTLLQQQLRKGRVQMFLPDTKNVLTTQILPVEHISARLGGVTKGYLKSRQDSALEVALPPETSYRLGACSKDDSVCGSLTLQNEHEAAGFVLDERSGWTFFEPVDALLSASGATVSNATGNCHVLYNTRFHSTISWGEHKSEGRDQAANSPTDKWINRSILSNRLQRGLEKAQEFLITKAYAMPFPTHIPIVLDSDKRFHALSPSTWAERQLSIINGVNWVFGVLAPLSGGEWAITFDVKGQETWVESQYLYDGPSTTNGRNLSFEINNPFYYMKNHPRNNEISTFFVGYDIEGGSLGEASRWGLCRLPGVNHGWIQAVDDQDAGRPPTTLFRQILITTHEIAHILGAGHETSCEDCCGTGLLFWMCGNSIMRGGNSAGTFFTRETQDEILECVDSVY